MKAARFRRRSCRSFWFRFAADFSNNLPACFVRYSAGFNQVDRKNDFFGNNA
jgi:hypothetical protein